MGLMEQIKETEADIQACVAKKPLNTQHLGRLKARLAKFKTEMVQGSRNTGMGGTDDKDFEVSKAGDARVAMIGFPSVGKSTLLTKLTSAESEAAAHEFTTLTAIPGKVTYKGAAIQLIDLPGIIQGAATGKGRGKQVIEVARNSDMVLMMLDASKGDSHRAILENELHQVGIRLNTRPADIYFVRKKTGGIKWTSTSRDGLSNGLDEAVSAGWWFGVCFVLADGVAACATGVQGDPAGVQVPQLRGDHQGERDGGRVHRHHRGQPPLPPLPLLLQQDRLPLPRGARRLRHPRPLHRHLHPLGNSHRPAAHRTTTPRAASLSTDRARQELNIDLLLARVWEYLDLVRVYTKRRGQRPDFVEPVILRSGSSVHDICRGVHKDLIDQFKYASVWGTSAKHEPQRVGLKHTLHDEDVIQIMKK